MGTLCNNLLLPLAAKTVDKEEDIMEATDSDETIVNSEDVTDTSMTPKIESTEDTNFKKQSSRKKSIPLLDQEQRQQEEDKTNLESVKPPTEDGNKENVNDNGVKEKSVSIEIDR